MKGRFFCFMLAMNLLICVSVAKRPFLSTDAMSHPDPKYAPAPYQTIESKKVRENTKSENVGMSNIKIGSSPPSCEHKCYGCKPCEAIQVPSKSSRRSHLRLEYANYEPESWKCKCGPSFYSP
ncbi:EPIDERMAL PATTERNING FACTOR-like protein 3 [Vicia villosa]|uniref:EPIDERMAL PATTERNING FACTOR-like protein 3 n=1 Tax=Vicia villosa TaxID=3911 RepID=UPI00273B28C8|nr:EPIDERMAL PATTERNING FACTOR-like protein 3 [Vicia villosa]